MQQLKKILVIRLSSIGDIVLATPLLRAMQRQYPEARVDFVAKEQYQDLLRCNPRINRLYTLDPKKGFSALRQLKRELAAGYDLIVDIHNNFRSRYLCAGLGQVVRYRKYRLARFLLTALHWNIYREIVPVYRRYIDSVARFGITDDREGFEFYPDPEVQRNMTKRLQDLGWRSAFPVLGIAPGAGFATKRWLPEYFAQVAQKWLRVYGAQIVLLGGSADATLTRHIAEQIDSDVIDLAGRTTLMETACAMTHLDLMLCNDSGLMHLANALKIRTVAIFGPTTAELGFFPLPELSRVVQHTGLTCRPCSAMGSKRCPKGHFRCMKELLPHQVLDALSAWRPTEQPFRS